MSDELSAIGKRDLQNYLDATRIEMTRAEYEALPYRDDCTTYELGQRYLVRGLSDSSGRHGMIVEFHDYYRGGPNWTPRAVYFA